MASGLRPSRRLRRSPATAAQWRGPRPRSAGPDGTLRRARAPVRQPSRSRLRTVRTHWAPGLEAPDRTEPFAAPVLRSGSMRHDAGDGEASDDSGRPTRHDAGDGEASDDSGRPTRHHAVDGEASDDSGRPMRHHAVDGEASDDSGRPMRHDAGDGEASDDSVLPRTGRRPIESLDALLTSPRIPWASTAKVEVSAAPRHPWPASPWSRRPG